MRNKLEWAVKILILATFFVPLIVLSGSFIFPFIVPKIVVFRSLIEIALGSYILLLIINWKEYKPDLSPMTIAVLAFYIFSFGMSTVLGVDQYHSFWDNHERMLGLFTIVHYVIYYFLLSKFFKNWTEWKWVMRIFLFAGFIVMFIAVLQIGSPNMLLNQGSSRVASTLGNPIYVGGYGMFLSFLSALLILKDKNKIWRGIYAALFVFAILGMFFSGTRGVMLGLVVGTGVTLLIYAIALRGYAKTRIVIGSAMVLLVVIVGILYVNRQTTFVQNIPAVGRAINTSLSDIMASPRWVAWEIAWQSFLQKPVFGWGPNNYFYAFNEHYNPKSLNFGYGETWFDNAHNIVMNTLAVQGGVGIITYFGLFAVGIYALIRGYRRRDVDIHLLAIGSGFLAAHFIANVTVFENITSYLYFIFWLAMINKLASYRSEASAQTVVVKNPDRKIGWVAITITVFVAVGSIYVFNIKPAKANIGALATIKALSSDPVLGLSKMNEAFAYVSPHIDDIRTDVSRTAMQLVYNYGTQIDQNLMKNIINAAYDAMSANVKLHPLDIRNQILISQIAQLKAYADQDQLMYGEAVGYLESAIKISPKRQQLYYTLAMMYAQAGQYDTAISLLKETVEFNSNIGESYWRMAYVYLMENKKDKADEILAIGEKNKATFSDSDKATINQIYASFASSTVATSTK
ncbi:MAG: O-antigen ligase family protein [Patescibacteria group bacterium]